MYGFYASVESCWHRGPVFPDGKTSFLRRKTMHTALSWSATLSEKWRFSLRTGLLCLCVLLVPVVSHADGNERYKAIPLASGGYVFILDTKEGHAWTWNSAGQGQVSPSGVNPHFTYQGNVRKNMNPPKTASTASPAARSSSERF